MMRAHFRIGIILSCLVLNCFPIYNQGEPGNSNVNELPEGFKGVKWGATAQEFHLIRPDITFDKRNRENFFGYNAEVMYSFRDNGKWFRMIVFVDESEKDALTLDFAHWLGRPKDNLAQWSTKDIWIIGAKGKGAPFMVAGLVDGYVGDNRQSYLQRQVGGQ